MTDDWVDDVLEKIRDLFPGSEHDVFERSGTCPICVHDEALIDGKCQKPGCEICGPEGAEDCDP